jgi:hypothetical protein
VGVGLLLAPSAALAQSSIAGVVRDASGAVLPGVTVEAASPVLIEKVRSAVTDGNGRFQIVDLRPGSYTMTFTLPGFNTVKREGIEIGGNATINVDAEMRVGALEETITVTGEAATVDTSSTTRQLVLDRDAVQLVPSGRNYYNLGAMVVGVASNSTDVGGVLGDTMSSLTTHGSKNTDQKERADVTPTAHTSTSRLPQTTPSDRPLHTNISIHESRPARTPRERLPMAVVAITSPAADCENSFFASIHSASRKLGWTSVTMALLRTLHAWSPSDAHPKFQAPVTSRFVPET